MADRPITVDDVDRWTRHLWHTSQHNRMTIGLAGRLQRLAGEMREAAGLPPFGWNTAFPGQETHSEEVRGG